MKQIFLPIKQLHKTGQLYFWLVLFLLCFFIQLLQLHDYMRFDRALIEQWQIWRLVTGHLTHLNWNHFMLNMTGLGIVVYFFANYQTTGYWMLALLYLALFCSGGLLLDGELNRYVGLSGVLHGLFIIGGRLEMLRFKASGIALLLLIIGKLIWEQLNGAMPGSESLTGGRIAINAHLYGAMAGATYLLYGFKNKTA